MPARRASRLRSHEAGRDGALPFRGQVENIGLCAAHLAAADPSGAVVAERRWGKGELDHPRRHGRDPEARPRAPGPAVPCLAVGHRVVHGGPIRRAGTGRRRGHGGADKLVPLAPLHQPHNLAPIRALAERRPSCRRWPASTPPSTARSPSWRRRSPCPRRSPSAACGATASTACRTNTSRACCRGRCRRAARGRVGRRASRQRRQHVRDARRAAASRPRWASPPLDGLPMGTRCGSLDPGVLLYLMDERGMDARAIENLLYQRVGAARRVGRVERHARAAREQRRAAARSSPSTCSSIASAASWARSPRRSAGSTRSCSPPARLLARRQLPVGRPDLPARQSAAARAAQARAHQAAAARPLGHVAGPEHALRPPQPGHQSARPEHDLHHRPGPRRPVAGRPRLPRRHLQRGLPEHQPGRRRA